MPRYSPDLTGQKFFRLTVIRTVRNHRNQKAWECLCSCGNTRVVTASNLYSGKSNSCGCYRNERTAARMTRHGHSAGGSRSKEYSTWMGMRSRCFNPADRRYADYGGRGITLCERWENSFEAFYADMGARPSPRHSIDRINNDGPYAPGNCRWATAQQQANNKRNNRILTHGGRSQTLSQWAVEIGIKPLALHHRIDSYGWSVDRALTTPVSSEPKGPHERTIVFSGRSLTLMQWQAETGIPWRVLADRLRKPNWSVEQVLTVPVRPRKKTPRKAAGSGWVFQLLTLGSETKTVSEWSKSTGIQPTALRYRIVTAGWTAERALTTPSRQAASRSAA